MQIAHRGRKPVFEIRIETILRLARLQIEEAEHERAGKAEQRRGKGDAHAAERRGKTAFQILEDRAGIAADLERLNDLADRADRIEQSPEGAEQSEEDEEAGEVARDVARFVETRGDRIEDRAHRGLRDRHAAGALAQQRRHRREQHGRPRHRDAGIGDAEAVHPTDFGKQPQDLADRKHDPDQKRAEDDAVETGIGEKGGPDLPIEDDREQREEDQEHEHPHEKNSRRGNLDRGVEIARHGRHSRCRRTISTRGLTAARRRRNRGGVKRPLTPREARDE